MGRVTGNWITGAHSGRACHHEDIYTKVNKKTGACYSVKLCNPNEDWTDAQLAHRSSFGIITRAINAWIKENKTTQTDDFARVKKLFDRQNKYSTLRGMIYAKGMYRIESDGRVTVDVTAKTAGTATAGGGTTSGGGNSNPSGGSGNNGGNTGSGDEGGGF